MSRGGGETKYRAASSGCSDTQFQCGTERGQRLRPRDIAEWWIGCPCKFNLAAPQSSLVPSPRRKYNQTSFAALPRTNPPTPQRFQSHVQPGFKTKPDSSFAVDANLLTSMQVEHRPCEAVLAGSRSCLHTTCYATGGGLGERSTAPPVADEAVRSSNEAQSGDSVCVPATMPNCGSATVLVQFSRPRSSLVISLKRKYHPTAPLPCQG